MENLEFTRIESVKGTMPGGIGAVIRYSIEMISKPELSDRLGELSVKQAMMLDIDVLAGQGLEYGEFITPAVVLDENHKPVMVAVAGTYSVEPDYDLLRRIARWRCNSLSDEALTREDFREAYGHARGGRFYSKWISLDRGIEPMAGYFADSAGNGQAFLGMVMKRVRQFEKRLNGKK